jgi:hypothetical protein
MTGTQSRSRFDLLAHVAFAFVALALLGAATGCSSLTPPFDSMKGAQMTIYRLQNYSPPAAPTGAPPAMGGLQLPPQIQQWISAGASLLPPGLIPPGLIPGSQPPAPATNVQRFPPEMGPSGFPIIAWQPVTDSNVQGQILDLLGHQSNFGTPQQNCMYAELGISIAQANNPAPANILVSLSCQQVQAFNFAWPYQQTGITPDAEKKFVAIAQAVFSPH